MEKSTAFKAFAALRLLRLRPAHRLSLAPAERARKRAPGHLFSKTALGGLWKIEPFGLAFAPFGLQRSLRSLGGRPAQSAGTCLRPGCARYYMCLGWSPAEGRRQTQVPALCGGGGLRPHCAFGLGVPPETVRRVSVGVLGAQACGSPNFWPNPGAKKGAP